MASTFNVSEILTDAARMSNTPDFASDTNVTATQATYWLIQSARSYTARLRQVFGENHDFLKEITLQTQPGFDTLSLPAEAGELHQVIWARTSSDYRLLSYAQADQLPEMQEGTPGTWRDGPQPCYRLEGETVRFLPGSSVAETVIIFYTSTLRWLDQTYFSARLDADRWMTLDVAVRVLQSQGRDPSVLLQDKVMLEAQLFNPARNRTPNRVVTIRDTRCAAENAAWRDRWSR